MTVRPEKLDEPGLHPQPGQCLGNLVWDPVGSSEPALVDDGLATEQVSASSLATVDYYVHDALGSTRALTSSSGSVVRSYTYNAWGGTTGSTGGITSDGTIASYTGNVGSSDLHVNDTPRRSATCWWWASSMPPRGCRSARPQAAGPLTGKRRGRPTTTALTANPKSGPGW